MPFYYRLGIIPHKRHTQFRRPDGDLYKEEVMGTRGFTGIQSILYHHFAPTAVKRVAEVPQPPVEYQPYGPLRHRHFRTARLAPGGDPVTGRTVLMGNADVTLAVCQPEEPMGYFYRNNEGDELLFIHTGRGRLETVFGTLSFGPGDYLVIPVGTTYRMVVEQGPCKFLAFAAAGPVETPRRYRNEFGQLLEHSPFCERDIRPPERLETHLESGEFEVRVRARGTLTAVTLDHHPFDVAGWDGYLFPWAINIADFEPVTGRVHQPPPVHQTFQGPGFVICSFVPRLFDYHPLAIPAPYNHSNVNSDEVLYYVDGNFMSRRGIEEGSITLHPSGIPHGPHPGAVEASIGRRETNELAVMMDTFRPLQVATAATGVEDDRYAYSWLVPPAPGT